MSLHRLCVLCVSGCWGWWSDRGWSLVSSYWLCEWCLTVWRGLGSGKRWCLVSW